LTLDDQPSRADELGGTYRSLGVSETGHDRLTTTVQASTIRISVADDGALVTESGGTTHRWIERDSLLFENAETGELLAFDERDGQVGYLTFGSNPATAYGKIGVVDRLDTHLAVVTIGLLGLLSGTLGWPTAALVRRFRGGDSSTMPPSYGRGATTQHCSRGWSLVGQGLRWSGSSFWRLGTLRSSPSQCCPRHQSRSVCYSSCRYWASLELWLPVGSSGSHGARQGSISAVSTR